MNAIAQLEQCIATVEALIVENQRRVNAEPENFAAALQLDSTKSHLDDLRQQLRQAKNARSAHHPGEAARERAEPARA